MTATVYFVFFMSFVHVVIKLINNDVWVFMILSFVMTV